jgi:hypothetical protein
MPNFTAALLFASSIVLYLFVYAVYLPSIKDVQVLQSVDGIESGTNITDFKPYWGDIMLAKGYEMNIVI